MIIRRILTVVVAGSLALGMAASAAGASVPSLKVKLIEFQVLPKLDFVAAGKTKIAAKNSGTQKHELVVVRGGDPTALPTKADGSIDESKIAASDKLGELPDIKKGKSKSKVFKLSPGKYIFFCNLVDKESDGTVVSHFAKGMYTVVDAS